MAVNTHRVPEREPARVAARQPVRGYSPREPHQKYHIDEADFPPGMDIQFVAASVKGANTGALSQSFRAGWEPARAQDFPEITGFGTEYPQSLIDRGLVENVKPGDPVEIDGQVLMMRPKEISYQAEKRREQDARELVQTQMQRLSMASRRAVKDRTEIKTGQYASPDTIPELRDAQEV